MPPVGQTFHTGGYGGGVDYPPPGLLCYTEGVGEKSEPGGLSVRALSLGIPLQGTSIWQVWLERTPYTVLVSRTYHDFIPPPLPPLEGGGGLAVGWLCRAKLCVAAVNGPRATWTQV